MLQLALQPNSTLIVAILMLSAVDSPAQSRALALLTNAAQVRHLSLDQAAIGVPVRLRGVLTYAEPRAGLAFLQDATAGVQLDLPVTDNSSAWRVGNEVELTGWTARGAFAPVVTLKHAASNTVQVLGQRPPPQPRRLASEELLGGGNDSQWVELRGSIRATRVDEFAHPAAHGFDDESGTSPRARLELNTSQGRYTLIIPWESGRPAPTDFMDTQVRVQGVLGSIVNSRGQWVGLLLYVPATEFIKIERPRAGDPFERPLCDAAALLKFSPEETGDERVRIRGTVLLQVGGYRTFLVSEQNTLEALVSGGPALNAGDRVDVSGYPTLQNKRLVLTDAIVRRLDSSAPAAPASLTVAEAMEQDRHGELVRIQGELRQNTRRAGERLLILDCQGQAVEATLAGTTNASGTRGIQEFVPGSVLELVGISQVLGSMDWSGHVRPVSFNLILRSAADVHLLRSPPWWTPQRLFGLVGLLLMALGLGAVWVVALRRRVAAQTKIIHERVEREAIWRDRSRIAQDIHDDLGASLTQIAFLSDRVQSSAADAASSRAMAARIAQSARATVRALDEIVWAVNPRHDTLQSLADYLCKLAREQFALTPTACILEVPPVLPEHVLRAEVRHNLALAVKEALHNVAKHASARQARLDLHLEKELLEITVTDDGRGFDPQSKGKSGNGLANLARRLKEIGGECNITSEPGCGTTVRILVGIGPVRPMPGT